MPKADPQPSFRDLVFSDLARHRIDAKPSWLKVFARCLTIPGMTACLILRAQQCLHRSGHHLPAKLLRSVSNVLVGADFGPGMQVGSGLLLAHPLGVTMGFGVRIGNDVTLAGGVTFAARYYDEHSVGAQTAQEFATVGDGTVIGAHAVIVGGVQIGRNAMVGANSVVLSDVPDNAVVFGVPARQIGTREEKA